MDTKIRIHNTIELILFIDKLKRNQISIPENITFEIKSETLKKEIESQINLVNYPNKEEKTFDRGEFMGQKIALTK